MNRIEVARDEHDQPISLHYRDAGRGKPVVLLHGWPLSAAMWEYQLAELPNHGLRAIAYDRRGFGHSSKPANGYDYDTLADDLKAVLDALELEDVTLVGFSMGGGEVARYMSRHRGARVGSIAFVSSVTPFLLKTATNPDGVDGSIFETMLAGLNMDWPHFLADFGKQFYGEGLLSHPVSSATLHWSKMLALQASFGATLECVRAFSETDFRPDLQKITVPTLIVHGDNDATVPLAASSERTAKILPSAHYRVYAGAPHGLTITNKDELTRDLVAFCRKRASRPAAVARERSGRHAA